MTWQCLAVLSLPIILLTTSSPWSAHNGTLGTIVAANVMMIIKKQNPLQFLFR